MLRTVWMVLAMALISFYSPTKAIHEGGAATASKWSATVNPAKGRPFRIVTNQTKLQIGTGPWNTIQNSSPHREHVLEWGTNALPLGSYAPASPVAQGVYTDFLGLYHFLDEVVYWGANEFDFVMWDGVSRTVKLSDETFEFIEAPRDDFYRGAITLIEKKAIVASFPSPGGAAAGGFVHYMLDNTLENNHATRQCMQALWPNLRSLLSRPLYESSFGPGTLVGKRLVLRKNPYYDSIGTYDVSPAYDNIPWDTPLTIVTDEVLPPAAPPACAGWGNTRRIAWSSTEPVWSAIDTFGPRVDLEIQD